MGEVYYPDRFEAVSFFDEEHCAHTVPLRACEEEDIGEADSGVYRAADSRKRNLADEEDPDSKVEKSVNALNRLERARRGLRYTQKDVQKLLRGSHARILKSPSVVEGDPVYIHITDEVAWHTEQVAVIAQVVYQVPMVAACVDTLKTLVMSDGLKFMRENVELVPSRDFHDYVVRRLHPFAFACIDAFLMLGMIPIVYELDPITGQRWPYVPAIGTYCIKRHTVRGAIRYRFYWTNEEAFRGAWHKQAVRVRDAENTITWSGRRESDWSSMRSALYDEGGVFDPSVEIVHNLGYELTAKGEVTSKVATLLRVADSRLHSQRARNIAESNAAAPPLITEYNVAAETRQSAAFQEGYYTSAAAAPSSLQAPESIESQTYRRDAAQREAFAGLLREYESQSGRSAAAAFGVHPSEYRTDGGGQSIVQPSARNADGLLAPWANQYHITSNRQLKAMPAARSSTDYVGALEYMDNEICGVFGVPCTYVLGTAIRAGTELVSNRLGDQVRTLKHTISDVLTHVYNSMFLGEDISQYMASEYRRRKLRLGVPRRGTERAAMPAPLLTEEDLYVVDAIKRVRVTFAKKASETPEELFQMFALGAIDQQVLCAELARRNNFDPSQLCALDAENEIPMEMRRFLIPQFADAIKFGLEKKKHSETISLQKKQLESQEKQAKDQLAVQKETAAAKAAEPAAKKPRQK